jgi:hypothetical protein
MRLLLAVLFAFQFGTSLAQTNYPGSVHFRAVDIAIDCGATPLAAYQLEFKATNGNAKIVGIEGGEPAAFQRAPYYDPKAMQEERVIIAAFSTQSGLPQGKVRVATIHLQISGDKDPGCSVHLQLTADAAGTKTPGTATFELRKNP